MTLIPEGPAEGEPEAEFWARVLGPYPGDPDDWMDEPPELIALNAPPCAVCGSSGACMYDAEGQPLIHTTGTEDDD